MIGGTGTGRVGKEEIRRGELGRGDKGHKTEGFHGGTRVFLLLPPKKNIFLLRSNLDARDWSGGERWEKVLLLADTWGYLGHNKVK